MPVTPTGRAGCRMAICVGIFTGQTGKRGGGRRDGWAKEEGMMVVVVGAEMFLVPLQCETVP